MAPEAGGGERGISKLSNRKQKEEKAHEKALHRTRLRSCLRSLVMANAFAMKGLQRRLREGGPVLYFLLHSIGPCCPLHKERCCCTCVSTSDEQQHASFR